LLVGIREEVECGRYRTEHSPPGYQEDEKRQDADPTPLRGKNISTKAVNRSAAQIGSPM